MIRWLCNLLWGPLCDQGTCFGQTGCIRRARWQSRPPVMTGSGRPLRWCHVHGAYGDPRYVVPLADPGQHAREGTVHKGGQNLTYQLKERPPDPPAMRPAAPLTDAQVLDADAELDALLARMAALEDLRAAQERLIAGLKEMRRRDAEELGAALKQLGEWRESVVAANRISQAFEERALRAEAERALLRRMVDDSIVGPIPPGQPAPLPDAPAEYVLGYLARYVLTGEGEAAEVDRWVAAARGWPMLYDEADATVSFAEMRRAAALVHEQPAAPSREPTT